MNNSELDKAIKQLCHASAIKVTVQVKPEVVIKEYRDRLQGLKTLIDQTRCCSKYKAPMYERIRKADKFQRCHRFNPDALLQLLKQGAK